MQGSASPAYDGDPRVLRDVDSMVEQRDMAREISRPESVPLVRREELGCEDDAMDGIEDEDEVVMRERESDIYICLQISMLYIQ